MPKKSEELHAQLAESIKAQPISGVEAAVQELRDAGLDAEADELAAVLEERKRQLDEARAAKAAEEAKAKAKAAAEARAKYDACIADYMEKLESAFEHLAQYVEVARPAIDSYNSAGVLFQNLVAIVGPNDSDLPELPPTPGAYAKNGPLSERLKGISL